jgi:hypothetical protein
VDKRNTITPQAQQLHEEACRRGSDTYLDPDTGYTVMTTVFHKRRGWCCGSGCRHCPYDPPHQGRRPLRNLGMVVLLCLLVQGALAQQAIDTVLRFVPGTGQNVGQGPVFFPQNIFQGPDPSARQTVQSMDPRYICSLGLGGAIDVGFKRAVVVDGPGPDFVVYENAFTFGDGKVFAEPAAVWVSKDGMAWIPFACDIDQTLAGCAGVTPLHGDMFDLADIGLDSVRWIRIEDRTARVLANRNHPFYDPTLSGFDLDVVIGLHLAPVAFETALLYSLQGATLNVQSHESLEVRIADMTGRVAVQQALPRGFHSVPLDGLPPGCYVAAVQSGKDVVVMKVLR